MVIMMIKWIQAWLQDKKGTDVTIDDYRGLILALDYLCSQKYVVTYGKIIYVTILYFNLTHNLLNFGESTPDINSRDFEIIFRHIKMCVLI